MTIQFFEEDSRSSKAFIVAIKAFMISFWLEARTLIMTSGEVVMSDSLMRSFSSCVICVVMGKCNTFTFVDECVCCVTLRPVCV